MPTFLLPIAIKTPPYSQSSQRSQRNFSLRLTCLAVVTCTLALVSLSSWAQTGSMAATPASTATMAKANPPGIDTSASQPEEGKMARSDVSLMSKLAKGNMGEIEAGKLALEKSQNADVKKFAQQMIDAHTQALGEVEALAHAKGVVLPDSAGVMARAKEAALKVTSGKFFDREYVKHPGVGDHESTVKLLKKIQKNARDDDLKALATKLLLTVEHHLVMARELADTKKKAS